jgi:hypothetical protein
VSGSVSRPPHGAAPTGGTAASRRQGAAAAPAPLPAAPPAAAGDRAAALGKLKALHASGVLTDEQFAAERARLLDD